MVISILDGVVKSRIQQRKVQYKKNTLIQAKFHVILWFTEKAEDSRRLLTGFNKKLY